MPQESSDEEKVGAERVVHARRQPPFTSLKRMKVLSHRVVHGKITIFETSSLSEANSLPMTAGGVKGQLSQPLSVYLWLYNINDNLFPSLSSQTQKFVCQQIPEVQSNPGWRENLPQSRIKVKEVLLYSAGSFFSLYIAGGISLLESY